MVGYFTATALIFIGAAALSRTITASINYAREPTRDNDVRVGVNGVIAAIMLIFGTSLLAKLMQ